MFTLVIAACRGSDGPKAKVGDPTASSSLQPASEARSAARDAKFANAALGESAEFFGIKVTVSTMAVGGDKAGPWLTIGVRAENAGATVSSNPQFAIVCAGTDKEGGWQADSTFRFGNALPAGSFDEGTVNLLLPEDGRYGKAVPECVTPAVVRGSATGVRAQLGGPEGADWPISDDLVALLNTARKP